jgi:hypothetical protein
MQNGFVALGLSFCKKADFIFPTTKECQGISTTKQIPIFMTWFRQPMSHNP